MEENKTFLDFAESLKLVRKTRIEDFIGDKNVDDIYTDLLPGNGVINKLNLPRTTILVGRKGTGKSTIFQKSQKDLINNRKCISIYIDVKSLYDNSTPAIPMEIQSFATEEIRKYLIYSNLIKTIILETKSKLNDFVNESILRKILGFELEKVENIQKELSLIETSIESVVKQIDVSLITSFKTTQEEKNSSEDKIKLALSKDPSLSLETGNSTNGVLKKEFESTLYTYLDLKSCLINNLLGIKKSLGIDHLYIFLDDFSEIEEDAQKIFMDWFIAPLNNLSSDFVKFKIAIYPNRFYYGKLDNSKIDEISLDFFDAYYSFEKKVDISRMESLALDYTNRLISKRLNLFFPNNHWERFFAIDKNLLIDILFSVSYNNPRKIGYILSYCYESCLIHGEKISIEAIENAAQRYYTDVIVKYFLANQFATKPFNDLISNEHQYELLRKIIDKQKTNCSPSFRSSIKGKPANHFILANNMTHLMNNLELNGFITTYNCTKDKNDELSTIFSLDYGLCKRNNIHFSRASTDKLIKYFSLPRFNMNILIVDYFNKTQVIRCSSGHEFPYSMLDTLKRYRMKCPNCLDEDKITICNVEISSFEIKEKLKLIENSNIKKTTFDEFILLDYLKNVEKTVSASKIANSIDKSEKTVINLINRLIERDFLKQDLEASRILRKDYYLITEKGTKFVNKITELIKQISNNQI